MQAAHLLKLYVTLPGRVDAREQILKQACKDNHVLGQDLGDVKVAQRAEQDI